jgi:glycosyltransferase involved in cell wall biosynthesis
MTSHFRERYGVRDDRAVTVHNGFDEADLALIRDRRIGSARPFTLCYSGAVYPGAYDVGPLVRAIRRLADAGTITPDTFQLLTLGSFPRDAIENAGIERFHEREGFVPRAQMFERFGEVDAFLLIEMGEYGAQMTYPVKVFDYLLTGKPVIGLVVPGGNCARLLADMGMTELPENREDAIAASIAALLRARGKPPTPVHTDRPPLARFRRVENARALGALLDAVTGQNVARIHSSSNSQRNTSV